MGEEYKNIEVFPANKELRESFGRFLKFCFNREDIKLLVCLENMLNKENQREFIEKFKDMLKDIKSTYVLFVRFSDKNITGASVLLREILLENWDIWRVCGRASFCYILMNLLGGKKDE